MCDKQLLTARPPAGERQEGMGPCRDVCVCHRGAGMCKTDVQVGYQGKTYLKEQSGGGTAAL